MIDDLSSISEEERCLFRPFTRESLVIIEGRIAEEHRKFKELERKRAEGEVVSIHFLICVIFPFVYVLVSKTKQKTNQIYRKKSNKNKTEICRIKYILQHTS